MTIKVNNAHFFNDVEKLLDLHDFAVRRDATREDVCSEMLRSYSYLDEASVEKTMDMMEGIGGAESYKFARHVFVIMRNHNEMAFRMAISELMSRGINFYQEISYDELYEAKGNALMTDAFARDILVYAKHLSRLDHLYLLAYVSREVEVYVDDDESLPNSRYKEIAESACDVATEDAFEGEGCAAGIDVLREIGLDEDEMKVLGFGWALENSNDCK